MKAALFCFSGTGNTRWVCDRFAEEGARSGALQTTVIALDQDFLDGFAGFPLGDYDRLGLAHPIYGANLPPLVRRFAALLEARLVGGTDLFVLATYGFVNGLGPWAEQNLFRRLRIRQYVNIRMPNNITTPKVRVAMPGPEEVAVRKTQALVLLKEAAARVVSGRKWITGLGLFLLPGIAIRRFAKSAIADHYKQMSVDTARCTLCMLCVTGCPTHAIRFDQGKLHFTSACTTCTRCYNTCPAKAILIEGTYADPKDCPRSILA